MAPAESHNTTRSAQLTELYTEVTATDEVFGNIDSASLIIGLICDGLQKPAETDNAVPYSADRLFETLRQVRRLLDRAKDASEVLDRMRRGRGDAGRARH